MQVNLRIAAWNANGASNHKNEIEIFLKMYFIDILLLSETHFTSRTYFNIPGYDLFSANHPDGKAHAGSAILVKSHLKYEIIEPTISPSIQASGVKLNYNENCFSVYAIYFPPRHNIKCDEYNKFFRSLGPKFIVGGDFNAKHTWWGSRLTNPKGKELYKCIVQNNYKTVSTGRPTYWPSDPNKIPDLLDFFVCSGISSHLLDVVDNNELSSDHTPILLNYSTSLQTLSSEFKLFSNKTDIKSFQYWMDKKLVLNTSLKFDFELDDAVEKYTNLIHEAAYLSTPRSEAINGSSVLISAEIRNLIQRKRRLRRIWQRSRNPRDKTIFNRASNDLKRRLSFFKNRDFENFLRNLSTSNNTEYSLWRATKYLKRPKKRNIPIKGTNGQWCKNDKTKADAFADHLKHTFQPIPTTNSRDDTSIDSFLEFPLQMDLPIKSISPREVQLEILKLNNKKCPGYDKINACVAKALSRKSILFLTFLYNATLRLNYVPSQWKCAEVIMVHKPGKPENAVESYRPISLLSTFSKIFERLLAKRLLPILEKENILPDHQFGFRHKHGTPEQCHRVINVITETFERKLYCSAVFLDVKQAFDRVWQNGLLYKIKKLFPAPFFLLIKSYLKERHFYVKINDETSDMCTMYAGVPQGSVLGPILYTIFTSDMPVIDGVTIATYADDTAIMAKHESPVEASALVQNELNILQCWLEMWRITINVDKSNHVSFSLRRDECPPLYLNGSEIPKTNVVKYLGMHFDKRLTWKNHVKAKREHLNIQTSKLYWLLGAKSQLSTENKLKIYKTILKPVWTYGLQLWGTTSESNIAILQRFQSKTLRIIVNAPWFITNNQLHRDLKMPKVKDEISKISSRYLERLSNHSNVLAISLLDETDDVRRLKRFHVLDLPFRK